MSDASGFQPPDNMTVPRYAGIPTFMRLPFVADPTVLDIAMVGVPFDGAVTNRAGTRHGPREVRNMSSLIRRVHHVTRIDPYENCKVGDAGDTPIVPMNLMKSLEMIEEFYKPLAAAGVMPLSCGGDHLITLPIFRAIAGDRPLGMVQFDAHTDTADEGFWGENSTTAPPFAGRSMRGFSIPNAPSRSAFADRVGRQTTRIFPTRAGCA